MGDLTGINITMPLKASAAKAADIVTQEAARAESVNSLRLFNGLIEGTSTDVLATREALRRFDDDIPVLILGSGGAARAIASAISSQPAYVSARSTTSAEDVASLIPDGAVVDFGTPVANAVVINATPLGMNGEDLPGPVTQVASGLIDLAYATSPTPSVMWMHETGRPVVDGVEFLAIQAAASFEWWTGVSPPYERMLAAARKH
jgi:shikimate dehydrogenase